MQLLLYPVPPREIGGIFKCIRKSVFKDGEGVVDILSNGSGVSRAFKAA